MRRSEIIAREVLLAGNATPRKPQRSDPNAFEVFVEDDEHTGVIAICVRAADATEAERVAVKWLAGMVRKGMQVRR
jgi:hypothetical protein